MMTDVLRVPANSHLSKDDSELEECPICHVALNKKNLSKHLKKVHSQGTASKTPGDLEKPFEVNSRNDFIKAKEKPGRGKVKARDWAVADYDSPNCGKVKINKRYYKCWQCGKLLTKASTTTHLIKKHGFRPKDPTTAHFWYFDEVIKIQYRDKSAATPAKKTKKNKEIDWHQEVSDLSKAKLPSGQTATVKCPVCEIPLNTKNVKKHFKKMHKELLQTQKQSYAVSSAKDKDVNTKKKSVEIRPDHEYSEDVFDRAKVYNGGAYGLGKSRKH